MALTADDANYLIYTYLQESGLVHSAYALGLETNVTKQDRDYSQLQQGCLVKLIQRGLQYAELEANLADDGTFGNTTFEVLSAEQIMTSTASELKDSVQQARREASDNEQDADVAELPCAAEGLSLAAHPGEVFAAAWSPNSDTLATYGNDQVCKIWAMGAAEHAQRDPACVELVHTPQHRKDVTVNALAWRPDSLYLATGATDGHIRVWHRSGELSKELRAGADDVMQVQYSPCGSTLLSASLDGTVCVWDTSSGNLLQSLATHTGPVLCTAWSGTAFATGSYDHSVHVFRTQRRNGELECTQLRDLRAHTAAVSHVDWAPNGWLLASCAEDFRALFWSMHQDSPLCGLIDDDIDSAPLSHSADVSFCKFRPAGYGSLNPNLSLRLATTSFDNTIKLWDCDNGALLHTLDKHGKAVYTCDWSPNGQLLATGAQDGRVMLWDVGQGTLVKVYAAASGVFDVKWHGDGQRLAVATRDTTVHVLDIRR